MLMVKQKCDAAVAKASISCWSLLSVCEKRPQLSAKTRSPSWTQRAVLCKLNTPSSVLNLSKVPRRFLTALRSAQRPKSTNIIGAITQPYYYYTLLYIIIRSTFSDRRILYTILKILAGLSDFSARGWINTCIKSHQHAGYCKGDMTTQRQ